MAGSYDNPFFDPARGGETFGFLYDPMANEAEISGNPVLYRVSGFGGVPQGGIQIPIDLSTENVVPVLNAKFNNIPIWVWLVGLMVVVVWLFRRR